jgi:hypothetical protein
VPVRKWLVIALLASSATALAKGDKKKAPPKDDDAESSDEDTSDSDDEKDADKDKDKGDKDKGDKEKPKVSDDEDKPAAPETNMLPAKQDLTGHDLGSTKKTTEFEKDRFFVDKIDTEKTEGTTLIQGSLTSSSFFYHESGGNLPVTGTTVTSNSPFDRYFTDLRLQTDFRHIGGGRWEGRFDGRLRMVDTPTPTTANFTPVTTTAIQTGLNGQNEYELRELWLIRNGERTDVIIGRQFIPDLGALKIDGLRIDYASSPRLTLLGFGGLYPLRGSRSITTDYADIEATPGKTDPAGPFVGATGFGGAYRTPTSYGSVGGVALVPLKGEEARVYATSTGYWRYGSVLDLYHFALIDLVGSAGFQLTNLSAGANLKPNPRLRMTLSLNHVDTETLNVQANGNLQAGDPNNPVVQNTVQNELTLLRLSSDQVRGSISAGLGDLQRFEITVASAYRLRPEFRMTSATGLEEADIPEARSVEVYGGITDRHSIKDARIGIDGVQTFAVGTVPYQRSKFFSTRVYVSHEIKDGQGEWEGEVSYSSSVDAQGSMCAANTIATCFGFTNGTVIALGGTLYYRFNRDWFGIGMLNITQTAIKEGGMTADPNILGLAGYARLAYRF